MTNRKRKVFRAVWQCKCGGYRWATVRKGLQYACRKCGKHGLGSVNARKVEA